jgi:hypothetical protein
MTHFPATSLKVQFAGVSAKMAGTSIAINHKICIVTGTNKQTQLFGRLSSTAVRYVMK